jgi:hypothetical protein
MTVFKKIKGTMEQFLQINGPTGSGIKESSGILEVRNSGDSDYVVARAADVPSSGSNLKDLINLLMLRGRVADIEFSFNGGTPPSAGANTNKFGFCHTAGGGYSAGDIVFDTGSVLQILPSDVATHLTSRSAVTGTISLIQNGVYAREGATWTIKGDGAATATGLGQWIEVPFDFNHTGSGVSSTTNLPDGARVLSTRVNVETLFDDTPTVTVTVDGSSPETLMAIADSDLTVAAEYHAQDTHLITSTSAGAIKVVVGGTPTVGSGRVLVEYIVAPLA